MPLTLRGLAVVPSLARVMLVAALVSSTTGVIEAASILHPGDKIDIVVYTHPDLSSTVTIAANGTISLPAAGSIRAEGLTPDELAQNIETRLAPMVKMVSVRVALDAQSQNIFVAGGPGGVLIYEPGESLVNILDRLQFSPTQRAQQSAQVAREVNGYVQQVSSAPLDIFDGPIDFTRVSILRDGKQLGPYDVIALRDAGDRGPALVPDDTIELVNKPVAVHVRGDVSQPGTAYLNVNDPLERAVQQVGGTTETSSQTALTLVRAGQPQVASLGSAVFAAPAVSGDEVIVKRAPRVDVYGTVVHPGDTYLRGNETLVAAIYNVGGPDRYANLKAVQVFHNGVKTEYNLAHLQKGHEGDNPPLVDGDVVFVPQGSTIDASLIFQAIASLGFLVYR
jgi:protein involved in polysaccharide export with SLBB domain